MKISNKYRLNWYTKFWKSLQKRFIFLSALKLNQELKAFGVFFFMFFLIFVRLFFLQFIYGDYYEGLLNGQHFSQSLLKANRGNIYVTDKAGKNIKLTENIDFFSVFIDPKYVIDKPRVISMISPLVYKHLCETYAASKPSKFECVQNLEKFLGQKILPKDAEVFYLGQGKIAGDLNLQLTGYYITGINGIVFDFVPYKERKNNFSSGYKASLSGLFASMSTGKITDMISKKLDEIISVGYRKRNYLGFFDNQDFLDELKSLNLPYVVMDGKYFVYIDPFAVGNIGSAKNTIQSLLQKYGYVEGFKDITERFYPQENRYVQLIDKVNPGIIKQFSDLKNKHFNDVKNGIPLLHGLGIDTFSKRYYPYGSFMANVLGYVADDGSAHYGIEEYFDSQLKGKDGSMIGRSSQWVGSNDFQVIDVVHGDDVYLTIDPTIQKEVENIIKNLQKEFKADSVSALVYDPFNGKLISSANYPTFDPNDFHQVFSIEPLSPDLQEVIADETYVDIPLFYLSGEALKIATTDQRIDPKIRKYIAKNRVGPQAFIDKNIAFPYEPGSIFKSFTVGMALDSDEISMYDFYLDEGKLKVGPYTISNVDKACLGQNTFLHALMFSCNVGMVRIAQKIGKQNFYNYVEKLGFGKLTNIELAGEDPGFVEDINTISLARFLNNSFGQGFLATPLQIAYGYATLVNGGLMIKPTILDKVFNQKTQEFVPNKVKKGQQVFKSDVSEKIKEALFSVVSNSVSKKFSYLPGYTLGGKSGTSQISYKGKYKSGRGWTNGSFVGIVTRDNLRYLVVVQVRRPRSNLRGEATAGRVFAEIAQFLISYGLIDK